MEGGETGVVGGGACVQDVSGPCAPPSGVRAAGLNTSTCASK